VSTRAKYYRINRPAVDALGAVNKHIANIDPKLRALVELRVSQINGCGYCIDLHSTQARSHGETQQRLDCLPAWWETDFFEPAEEAAFRWAEALTHVSTSRAPEDVYQALTAHFSEAQIVDLSLVIAMINARNRLAIGHHSRPAKRAES